MDDKVNIFVKTRGVHTLSHGHIRECARKFSRAYQIVARVGREERTESLTRAWCKRLADFDED